MFECCSFYFSKPYLQNDMVLSKMNINSKSLLDPDSYMILEYGGLQKKDFNILIYVS